MSSTGAAASANSDGSFTAEWPAGTFTTANVFTSVTCGGIGLGLIVFIYKWKLRRHFIMSRRQPWVTVIYSLIAFLYCLELGLTRLYLVPFPCWVAIFETSAAALLVGTLLLWRTLDLTFASVLTHERLRKLEAERTGNHGGSVVLVSVTRTQQTLSRGQGERPSF